MNVDFLAFRINDKRVSNLHTKTRHVQFKKALVSVDALRCSRMLCFLSHPQATSANLILIKQAYDKIFIPLTMLFQATFCHLLYFQNTERLNLISKVKSFWIDVCISDTFSGPLRLCPTKLFCGCNWWIFLS